MDATGSVHFTLALQNNRGAVTGSGRLAGPNQVIPDPPWTNTLFQRLDDASRCAGAWSGTLSQTNGPGAPANYPVSFDVDSRGWVSNFTGFPALVVGRAFALSNGAVAAAMSTGLSKDDPYNQVSLSGTLSGNVIQGTYAADHGIGPDGVFGTVSLTRH